jgi:D-alanyl-lipoteichoic acid acyltransferase DltB (MBOAT superfamily)
VLFNSYEFIFGFLPAAVLAYLLLGFVSRSWALRAVILASLFFYAWWRPINVLIIAPSIVINFLLARAMLSIDRATRPALAYSLLVAGILFNVAFLGYFKYANFAVSAVNDVFGTRFVLEQIILPLGISFITFQKIAFLMDVHARRVQSFGLEDYCLFVLFFPQLIAGPIVHYGEMMPQFRSAHRSDVAQDMAAGLTLFVFGLAKKVLLADSIAPAVTTIYQHASAGDTIALLPAWIAAAGFTLQIYFDFSGYSDMALGSARFFGIRLPPNFNSPLCASSIIDFWLRWHMSLTRFLTAYIYNPLALVLTRRRLAKGLGGLSRDGGVEAFVSLLAFPTLLTMFVSGIWHGAGYLFVLWGLLHGLYLTVNHGWRRLGPGWSVDARYAALAKPAGFVLTLLCVVVSMVVFRATDLQSVTEILRGMAGLNGVGLPLWMRDAAGVLQDLGGGLTLDTLLLWMAGLSIIVFGSPNTLQLLDRYEPALGWKPGPQESGLGRFFTWRPSSAWLVVVSLIAAAGVLQLGGQSEFLYWQF